MSDHKRFDNDEHCKSVRQAKCDRTMWFLPHRMSPDFDTTKTEAQETEDQRREAHEEEADDLINVLWGIVHGQIQHLDEDRFHI